MTANQLCLYVYSTVQVYSGRKDLSVHLYSISQCLTSRVAGRGGAMVVKDTIENKEDTNRISDEESGEESRESDHRNGVEDRSGESLENVRLKVEEEGDDEADPVDLIRLVTSQC